MKQLIVAIVIAYVLGVGTATAAFYDFFNTYKNRKGIKYHRFEKRVQTFTSLIFDGIEYVPREWYDKACQAFFRKKAGTCPNAKEH